MSFYTANKTRRSLIDTVAFRILSQVATVSSFVILVRGMSKEDFGIFSLLYSFIPVLGTVASFGLEQILRRYQPEYLRAGNVPGALALVRFVTSARFTLNIVMIGLVLLVWNLLAPVFDLGPYRIQFSQFAVLLILHFQVQILTLSLASHMMHRYSAGSVALLSFGKLIGYSVMLYSGSFSLVNAIIADTVAYAAVYAFLRMVYQRKCVPKEPVPPYKVPPEERKRMFRYGLYNNFNDAGALMLGGAADNFFIAAFIEPVAVGIYAFYGRLNGMAINLLPVRLFDNIIQPLFFSIKPEEADKRVRQYFTFLLDINIILLWPMLAFATIYHAELVTVVFGGKYVEHSWLLPMILFFSTVNSIAVPVTLVAQYQEKAGIILLSKIFVGYNIVAMLVLLPFLGVYGAILARGSAESFKNLFIWWWVRDRAKWDNCVAVLGTALVLWGGVVAAGYIMKSLLPGPPLAHMLFGVLMCGAGLLVYVRTPAIAHSDRQILSTVFKGKEARVLQRLGVIKAAA